MAIILKTDGTRKDIVPIGENGTLTLEQMQEVVGGYIEKISAPNSNNILIVDEEGRLKGKSINLEASAVA
jgi:hypothetical protein